jgi:hypothetical protein
MYFIVIIGYTNHSKKCPLKKCSSKQMCILGFKEMPKVLRV